MIKIFLSHSSSDKDFARSLTKTLMASGIGVWLDEAELDVGDSLIEKLQLAIRECTYVGIVLSPASVDSQWVQREVNMALTEEIHGRRVKVIPLLHKPCRIPGFLLDKVHADFTKDFEFGAKALLRRIMREFDEEPLKKKSAYELLQSGYQGWLTFGKSDDRLLSASDTDLILEHVLDQSLSVDLLEYVLSCICFRQSKISNVRVKGIRALAADDLATLLRKMLRHDTPLRRVQALKLFELIADSGAIGDCLMEACEDQDSDVRRAAVEVARGLGFRVPEELAIRLFNSDENWIVQTYATCWLPAMKNCLIISDGTDFAEDMQDLAREAGFQVVVFNVTFLTFALREVSRDMLDSYSLVIITRGEHFIQGGNEEFYVTIRDYIHEGGMVVATPWVSWETSRLQEFSDVLPFRHVRDTYNEGIVIEGRPTQEQLAIELGMDAERFRASIELLEARHSSKVLFRSTESIPLLGYKPYGAGICYYFNVCQHMCVGKLESPLKSSKMLRNSIGALFSAIHRSAHS